MALAQERKVNMKIRQGFVSNSSSASFVITAKCSLEEFNKLIDTSTVIRKPLTKEEEEDFCFSTGYDIEEDALGNTTIHGWTVMHNSDEDFGPGFKEIQETLWNKNVPCKVEVSDEG